jgi:PleD family two-component response regulator
VTVVDLSPEGVGFISEKQLAIGMSVYFLMDLDNGESVKFIAKVRWSKGIPNSSLFKIGVKILDSSRKDLQSFIRFYCRSLIPGDERRKKILVIESDKSTAKLLYEEITQNGYVAVCAYDGEIGFSKYMDERPDLVILNYALPKLNGYEVCRKIRKLQNDRDTSIFMLIAKKKDVSKIVEDGIGIQKYFMKPLKIERVLEEINRIMAKPKD